MADKLPFSDFEDKEPPPHSRGGTSEAAAWSMHLQAGTYRRMVFDYILFRGDYGATCDEVEQAIGVKHQNVSARIWELKGNPLKAQRPAMIEDSGRRRKTRSGRSAEVLVAVHRFRDVASKMIVKEKLG